MEPFRAVGRPRHGRRRVIAQVGVVVPAANEAEHLHACCTALLAASARLRMHRPAVDVRILVVLDKCTDTSLAITERLGIDTISTDAGRVGAARAAGVTALLATRADVPLRSIWVANTDADCVVPVDWLVRMTAAADAGADVVLGTVLPGPGLADAVRRRWHQRHVLVEGHRHVHGANFGIRADVYSRLGGWQSVSTGEDTALAARAEADAATRVLRTAAAPVLASPRLAGRAPHGFAGYLLNLSRGLGYEPTS
jgi:glycosyltransferase involved in cell wall biosynthesis